MIVLDASAALEILLRGPKASAIETRVFADGETLHAPNLIDLEIVQVLRRHVSGGRMAGSHAARALDVWRIFPLRRYAHSMLLTRIWALRDTLTAYDAAYIALAETLGAVVICTDAKLARAAGHFADVEVLA